MKNFVPKKCVSVIVPCYNYGKYLADALDSIQMQTFQNWECIIVDDGSVDNTKDIATKYLKEDNRFRYLHQKNRGLSNARNTGIRNSTGSFIQLLDADDVLEDQKLQIHADYLIKHQSTDLVYGDARFFDSENPKLLYLNINGENDDWMPRVSGSDTTILKYLVKSNFMVVSAPLLSRHLFDINGYFNETLKSHEDWDFWLRCAINGAEFRYLCAENTMALIRTHKNSMSNEALNMTISNLAVRGQLPLNLKSVQLRTINSERVFSYALKVFVMLWKKDRIKAITFFLKHLPYNHGVIAFLGGFLRFNRTILSSLNNRRKRSAHINRY